MVKGELVVLTFWFPNAPGLGEKLSAGWVPVPVKMSEPNTVPLIVKVPDRAPVVDGVKVSFTVQEALAGMVPPLTQVPVPALAKLVGFVPPIVK